MADKNIKLSVQNLSVSFRTTQGFVRAVRDISFDLYQGETLAVVGESGSGKSVTSRAIMGILEKNSVTDSGKVIYENEDILKIREEDFHKLRGNKIGMIFQDPLSSLNPIMRIGKQVTEGMIVNGKHLKNRKKELSHKERRRYLKLVDKLKNTTTEFKLEKKRLKEEKEQEQISILQTKHAETIKSLAEDIKVAKQAYKEAKQKAKAQVDQEWKAEKEKYAKKIADVKSKLSSASQDEKKVYQNEISDLK